MLYFIKYMYILLYYYIKAYISYFLKHLYNTNKTKYILRIRILKQIKINTNYNIN